MKFYLASDLHCEFATYNIPQIPDHKDSCLLLAGDIMSAFGPRWDWLERISDQFKYVVYVFGNHEYYGLSSLSDANAVRDQITKKFPNIITLEDSYVDIEGIIVIGSTMWTDYDRNNHLAKIDALNGIRDFTYIDNITPDVIYDVHVASRDYMFEQVAIHKSAGKKVICVMHHAPTWYSLATGAFVCNKLNGAYASDLSNHILNTNPDVVVHGHIHESVSYECGDTQVYANPRGYPHDSMCINDNYMCDFSFTLE